MEQKILEALSSSSESFMSIDEIFNLVGMDVKESGQFYDVLENMVDKGKLIKSKKNRYALIENTNFYSGVFHASKAGYGFISANTDEAVANAHRVEFNDDLYVHRTNVNSAMNGDVVLFEVLRNAYAGKVEARVLKVLKRENSTIIGEFYRGRKIASVFPDDKKIINDIYVDFDKTLDAKTGQKVVVKVLSWPNANGKINAQVIEVLGYPDEFGVDILSVIRKFKLPDKFPQKVAKAAQELPNNVLPTQLQNRRDLRNDLIITIDGADAKDLDDAVSVRYTASGTYMLDVHIADVSEYVRENTQIDREAFKRGTSVYLVNKVIPMLPVELSNGICSLNPHEDRLTLSCQMEIDKDGKILNYDIYESVINSKFRMTYTDVSDIIEGVERPELEKYDILKPQLMLMKELCEILRDKRDKRGSLDFNFVEAKIEVDENGEVADIKPDERRIANRIIEEFMLAANETVAQYAFWGEYPFVYRVHQKPDDEKIKVFQRQLVNFGIEVGRGFSASTQDVNSKAVQGILETLKGTKQEKILNKLLLRSLKKAKYSASCDGHFGLACKYYCHFTSPIRRYPDLQIHRILKLILHGQMDEEMTKHFDEVVSNAAEISSACEVVADDAERDAQDMKKAQYMANFIGDEFDGIISSIMPFGIFVELENTVEGMVRLSSLDDYYEYDDQNITLRSESGELFSLGDKVRVQLVGVDEENREIDFIILD